MFPNGYSELAKYDPEFIKFFDKFALIRIGNDKNFLIKVVSQCLPYIGYPRSLNAISCIDAAIK